LTKDFGEQIHLQQFFIIAFIRKLAREELMKILVKKVTQALFVQYVIKAMEQNTKDPLMECAENVKRRVFLIF